MPAKKPVALITRAETKVDRNSRVTAETALIPKTRLTVTPPAALHGHKHATATWKHTINLYGEITGTIATAFDEGIVIDYCLLVEQLIELDELRAQSLKSCDVIRKQLKSLTAKIKHKDAKTILAEQLAVNEKLESILALIIKLDGRIDRKRSLVHTLRQSLYLTPRSRAGVAPPERQAEIKTEMDNLLDEVDI